MSGTPETPHPQGTRQPTPPQREGRGEPGPSETKANRGSLSTFKRVATHLGRLQEEAPEKLFPTIGRYQGMLAEHGLSLIYEDQEEKATFNLCPSEALALADYLNARRPELEMALSLEQEEPNVVNAEGKPFRVHVGKGPDPIPRNKDADPLL